MKSKEFKEAINSFLSEYFKNKGSYNKIIYESAAYSLNIGGKRIRPILFLLGYNLYKNNWEDVIPVAAAIEMIHTYSLVHDDLPCMDNDDLRRGRPTNHKVFGEDIAVLAGDALLNEAMLMMMDFSVKNGINSLEGCKIIAEAAGAEGMIGGQIVDIINEGKKISSEELEYMHLKKTGELIRSAIVSGAFIGGASEEEIMLLNDYGKKLGLAFQIKDDVLDLTGTTEQLGKDAKSDLDNQKTNFISVYGLEKCVEMCETLTNECLDILNKLEGNTEELSNLTSELLNREY